MAREAGVDIQQSEVQELELQDDEQRRWLFRVPHVTLSAEALDDIDWEFS